MRLCGRIAVPLSGLCQCLRGGFSGSSGWHSSSWGDQADFRIQEGAGLLHAHRYVRTRDGMSYLEMLSFLFSGRVQSLCALCYLTIMCLLAPVSPSTPCSGLEVFARLVNIGHYAESPSSCFKIHPQRTQIIFARGLQFHLKYGYESFISSVLANDIKHPGFRKVEVGPSKT